MFGARETEGGVAEERPALPIHDAQPGLVTYLDAYARDVVAPKPPPLTTTP